jgi:hypothetical protein
MKKERKLGVGITLGITLGTAVGVATDNLGLWLALGVAIGAGVGTAFMQQGSKKTMEMNPIKVANKIYKPLKRLIYITVTCKH